MRIFMLGWEFPPFIAGGLGTACYGLTKALDRQGHEVIFVLPKPVDAAHASHVELRSPNSLRELRRVSREVVTEHPILAQVARAEEPLSPERRAEFEKAVFHALPADFSSPYPSFAATSLPEGVSHATIAELIIRAERGDAAAAQALAEMGIRRKTLTEEIEEIGEIAPGSAHYGTDLFGDAHRYARLAVALARREQFDVIHAHDWLTYPAGMAVKAITGKPLVVHVHATEFDRSGEHVNKGVYDIERAGMHAADRLIAVSMLTKNICERRYGIPSHKIEVVYNGVDQDERQPIQAQQIGAKDKIVLFLGRITMQKGPEYFIAAAKRVLEKVENVKFVVAGSGDLALRMIEQAAQLGIGAKVLFTGFLRGADVERVFRMADCYVMPSVSEPFGIAALEAMHNDTPVIISKTSGVAEVLQHALKVDFWDVDEMANKIVAVLRYPPLSKTLREHGAFEVRALTWDGAAQRCVQIYRTLAGH
ncbi:MAG: glycosyltransferase [Phycisphaeraceae bacterium]|nr:glycosyltransferase [Phycisphaeraceae bacterium]